MFGRKSQEKPPVKQENIFTEPTSERFAVRYHGFLAAMFVAWNAAYPVSEDLMTAAEHLPDTVRAAWSSQETHENAQRIMKEFQEGIEKGEPLPVDLFDFYIEQERQVGGVDDATIAKAKEHFAEIITSANVLRNTGKSQETVMGYVLKQQGTYDDTQSRLATMLAEGRGECEARQRYVSAAMQVLYPEQVAAGKLKIETFRSYVDEQGVPHSGHVRAVLDDGERVAVLEGDAMQWESRDKHEQIGMHEATQLAVKSFAAKEGLYSFKEENASVAKEVAKQEKQDAKRLASTESPLAAAKKLVHSALTDNGVSVYPNSTATYKSGERGSLDDIRRGRVGGRWDMSREFLKNAIEVTLVKEPRPMTENDLKSIFRYDVALPALTEVVLTPYSRVDADVMRQILLQREEKRKEIQPDNGTADDNYWRIRVPATIDLPTGVGIYLPNGENFVVSGNVLPPSLQEIPLHSLTLENVTDFPDDQLNHMTWTPDAKLRVIYGGTEYIVHGPNLKYLVGATGLTSLALDGGDLVRIVVFEGTDSATLRSLSLRNIRPQWLMPLTVDQITWSIPNTRITNDAEMFAEVTAARVDVHVGFEGTESSSPFNGSIFRSSTSMLHTHELGLGGRLDMQGAVFKGLTFDVLKLDDAGMTFSGNPFDHATINTLAILNEPGSSTSMTPPNVFTGMDVAPMHLVFIVDNPKERDVALADGVSKTGPGLSLHEQAVLMRDKQHVSVVIMESSKWTTLMEAYADTNDIPKKMWESAAYDIVY